MRQTHHLEMRRSLNGQDVRRVLKKHSESRLQPRTSTAIPLSSVQFISSQSKRPQMYMTHYCSYEEMSNWAGSWRGECRPTGIQLSAVSPITLEGSPCSAAEPWPQDLPLALPHPLPLQLMAQEHWNARCPGRGALSGPTASRPCFLCKREALIPAGTWARHLFLLVCP